MSDAFFEYLSDDVRALCRLVDKCTGLLAFLLLLTPHLHFFIFVVCSQGICRSNVLLHL